MCHVCMNSSSKHKQMETMTEEIALYTSSKEFTYNFYHKIMVVIVEIYQNPCSD